MADGVIFYLPPDTARDVVGLGVAVGATHVVVSYWPTGTEDNAALAAQRGWFRRWNVP
ncbi:hypothetical protein ABGB07_07235 [Micromonosporaceae bacterium B7E4]